MSHRVAFCPCRNGYVSARCSEWCAESVLKRSIFSRSNCLGPRRLPVATTQDLEVAGSKCGGYGHNTPFDWVQTGIDHVPDSIYLGLAILAAFSLYWTFSRG